MKRSSAVLTGVDQAWLSLLNFAISIAFIQFATKQDYGFYLLLLTPIYLAQGLQNAVLLSPINTVLPASNRREHPIVLQTAVSALAVFLTATAGVGAVLLLAYVWMDHHQGGWALSLAFGCGVAGYLAREGARSLFYARGSPVGALRSDAIYGIGLIFILSGLVAIQNLTATSAFFAIGIAALWPYAFQLGRRSRFKLDRDTLQKLWACGRWALVGVLVTWINLSAYPLVVGFHLDVEAVADINAARLFMMPFVVGITGWSNLVRPYISGWAARGQQHQIKRLSIKSIAYGLCVLAAFIGFIWLLYPRLEPILNNQYRGLLGLVLLWGIYFAVSLTRTVLMASLMTDEAGYKALQGVSWYALVVSLTGLWFLTPYGTNWVVLVLVAVEVVQLVMIGRVAIKRWSAAV